MNRSHRAAIAVHRFGLGARPGERAAAEGDPEAWLLGQLDRPAPGPAGPSAAEALARFAPPRGARGQPAPANGDEGERRERIRAARGQFRAEAGERALHRITTPTPFAERLVAFWSNHFTVSTRQARVLPVAVALEREAIRPAVTGRFEEMLVAVVQHPAMLLYLDNQRSIGPNSRVARRREGRGLNENLARELLELHTLGVDGGYTQDDVIALAGMLTGWSLDRTGEGSGFAFRSQAHEPGPKRLLGATYRQGGVAEGEAALRALARHPSTAQHVCTKLARHFVADAPPPAVVAELTRVYLDTDGDLGAVTRALVARPEAWTAAGTKLRSPEDWLTAMGRALTLEQHGDGLGKRELGDRLVAVHDRLGQPLWTAPSPAGWPDEAQAWAGSEALLERVELAGRFGRLLRRRAPDAEALGDDVLGPLLPRDVRRALRDAPSRAEALALLLLSPPFLRR